jgi:hypothetical protein
MANEAQHQKPIPSALLIADETVSQPVPHRPPHPFSILEDAGGVKNTSRNLTLTINRLDALFDDIDLHPTAYAYTKAYSLLVEAAGKLGGEFPHAAITIGEDENLYAYWIEGSNSVELTICPTPAGKHAIYSRLGGIKSLETTVNEETLASYLVRFNQVK